MRNILVHTACLSALCLITGCATVRGDDLAASIASIGHWGGNAPAADAAPDPSEYARTAPPPVASAK